MKNTFYYNTKIGEIAIEENGLAITRLYFVNKDLEKEVEIKEETWLMRKAIKEIKEYLEGKRNSFDLPLEPEGTEFQKKGVECFERNSIWRNKKLWRNCKINWE